MIGINTIQQQLINEIKDAKFRAVMADEVTSVNDELVSICFRYVDGQKDIREVFLQFLKLEQLYYHFINPQGLTSNKAEANAMMRPPTCNQKNQEQLLGF